MTNLQNLTVQEVSKLKEETIQKINALLNEFEEKTGTYITDLNFTRSNTENTYIGLMDDEEAEGTLMYSKHTPASVTIKISLP